ncbi:hypothetical protein F5X96DRAFT_694713 [Biscogniauxia mediterranea]|nr:hypothetical protein F5X96DRAFT_694713 [Biscogniauxia mediterranea]
MPGYKVGHEFAPRPSGRVEADRVALHYSKTTESHGPRKTYLIGDDGELIETGLQYRVVSFDQPEPGMPELDSDGDITAGVESSRGSSLDSELDAVCEQLTDEDRMLMEEFGMTEEEFAEYISDVDSFGTASSDRSSILSVETDASDDAPVEATVSPAVRIDDDADRLIELLERHRGSLICPVLTRLACKLGKKVRIHRAFGKLRSWRVLSPWSGHATQSSGSDQDAKPAVKKQRYLADTDGTSSADFCIDVPYARSRRGPRALPKPCGKEVPDDGYVKDCAAGLLASG